MKNTILKYSMLSLIIIYMIGINIGGCIWIISAILSATILCITMPEIGKSYKRISWCFILIAVVILLLKRVGFQIWVDAFNSMLNNVVILICVKFLAIPMRIGRYDKAVTDVLIAKPKSKYNLFVLLEIMSHILASVLSLGAVPVILSAVKPAVEKHVEDSKAFMTKGIMCGYSTLFLWAPSTVTVLMCIHIFNISWGEYFFPAFILAMIGILLGIFIGRIKYRGDNFGTSNIAIEITSIKEAEKKVIQLILNIILIIFGYYFLEISGISTSTGRIVITVAVVSFMWTVLQRNYKCLKVSIGEFWNKQLITGKDLITFFICMGLFSEAIKQTAFDEIFLKSIPLEYINNNGIILLIIVPILVVGISYIGIHPFVSVLIFGPMILSVPVKLTSLQLALDMSVGCCLTYLLSPFAGVILALAEGLEERPINICVGINLFYSVLFYFISIVYIIVLGYL